MPDDPKSRENSMFGQPCPQPMQLTRNRKTVIYIPDADGNLKPCEIDSVKFGYDENGQPCEITSMNLITDDSGRVLTENALGLYAKTWSNRYVPKDKSAICTMCEIEKGVTRYIFIGVDGIVTEKGNYLCHPCVSENQERKRKYKRFWGFVPQKIY